MKLDTFERRVAALIILSLFPSVLLRANTVPGSRTTTSRATAGAGSSNRDLRQSRANQARCGECGAATANRSNKNVRSKNGSKRPTVSPCHPPGYVDPRLARDFNAALREMKRAGIQPKITSTWRSSGDQDKMYQCSISRRCRIAHPGLYRALPPGQSVHEAGFAVDISGIATGPRGDKRLTSQGRRIVQIMEAHGFRWRYGLMDPVHFEADPQEHGYASLKQAILVNQTRCQAAVAQKRNAGLNGRTRTLAKRNSEEARAATAKRNREGAGPRAIAKQNTERRGTPVNAKRGGEKTGATASARPRAEKRVKRTGSRQQTVVKVAQRKTTTRDHKRLPSA